MTTDSDLIQLTDAIRTRDATISAPTALMEEVGLCARAMPAGTTSFHLVRMSNPLLDKIRAAVENNKNK